MTHGPQCPCCAGTDVAHEIGQQCYAEEQQRHWDEERRHEEEAYEAYADHAEVIEAIIAFARYFMAPVKLCRGGWFVIDEHQDWSGPWATEHAAHLAAAELWDEAHAEERLAR